MKPFRLTLVRHAEVEQAWVGRCYGQSDVPLSPEGLARTHAMVSELAGESFAAIITSDLSRCRLPAEPLAERLGISLAIDSRLRERDYGAWESHSWDDLWREHGELIHATVSEPATFHPGGGETTDQLRDRVMRVVNELGHHLTSARDALPHYCLVTHGGPSAAILGTLGNKSVYEWHGLQPRQGQYVSIMVQ